MNLSQSITLDKKRIDPNRSSVDVAEPGFCLFIGYDARQASHPCHDLIKRRDAGIGKCLGKLVGSKDSEAFRPDAGNLLLLNWCSLNLHVRAQPFGRPKNCDY